MFSHNCNKHYIWNGLDDKGSLRQGTTKAYSKRQLKTKLYRQGIFLMHCQRCKHIKAERSIKLTNKVWIRCIEDWLYGLESQLPLNNVLQLCLKQPSSANMVQLHRHCLEHTERGQTLHSALMQLPNPQPTWLLACIAAGEHSGTLIATLKHCHKLMKQGLLLQTQLRRATSYPAFLIGMACCLCVVMLIMILPKFTEIYQQLNTNLPEITQALLHTAHALKTHSITIIVALLLLCITAILGKRLPTINALIDHCIFKLPKIGSTLLSFQLARWYGLMHLLLNTSLPLDHALEHSANSFSSHQHRYWCRQLLTAIRQGKPLSQACMEFPMLPKIDIERIALGEQSGRLSQAFDSLSQLHQTQLQRLADTIGRWLEPAILIGVTGFIGGIVMALYAPLFQLGHAL